MKKLKINKKVLIIVLSVLGILLLAGGITLTVLYIRSTKEDYEAQIMYKQGQIDSLNAQIMYKQGQIDSLNAQIADIGSLITVFELKYDVKSGTIIDEQDLNPVMVPQKASAGFVTDINEAVGKRYKTDINKGDLLTTTLTYNNDLTNDLRYRDITLDKLPIGLEVGDYIDIRFKFTMGQTFLALEHKEVFDINSNTIKILISAAEEHVIQSMDIDKMYYVGCERYALQYVDGGVQEKGKVFYPIRYEELLSLTDDPNVPDDFDYDKYTEVDRSLYDAGLISSLRAANNEVDEELAKQVEALSQSLEKSYQDAQEAYQAKQAGGSGTSGSNSGGDGGFGVMN